MSVCKQNSLAILAIGILLGIGATLGGAWMAPADPADEQARFWASLPVHATATENHDNFAIATGLVDSGVEALYFLDYLTGDLRAAVIDPKTGRFNSFFTYNLAADFGGGAGGSPKYLMVTGSADMPRGRSGFQPASSILYIADCNTGQVGAYIMPWNSSMQAAGKPQTGTFQRLDMKQFRTAVVRDE